VEAPGSHHTQNLAALLAQVESTSPLVLLMGAVELHDCMPAVGFGHRRAPDILPVVEVAVAVVVHGLRPAAVAEARFDSDVAEQRLQIRMVLAAVVEVGHVVPLAWPHIRLCCIRPRSADVVDSTAGSELEAARVKPIDSGFVQAETDMLARIRQSHVYSSLRYDSAYLHTLVVVVGEELPAAVAAQSPPRCQVSDSLAVVRRSAYRSLALFLFQVWLLRNFTVAGLDRSDVCSYPWRVCEPSRAALPD
jgi:uncharacterized membrane protein